MERGSVAGGVRGPSGGASQPPSPGAAAAPTAPRAPPPAGTVRPRHVAWAELLRRTFGLDVLACPDCGGRLRLVATIAKPQGIARILPTSRAASLRRATPRVRPQPAGGSHPLRADPLAGA